MKKIYLISLVGVMMTIATPLLAMNRACLSDCFATGHDCDYCAYECNYNKYVNRYHYSREDCFINLDEAD